MAGLNQLPLISSPVAWSARNVEFDIDAVFDRDYDTAHFPATECTITLQRCPRQSQEQRQRELSRDKIDELRRYPSER
jgi:hypothetical protein